MTDTDQLPDGVERERDVDEYTGRDLRLYTTVSGHGRVREMWIVIGPHGDIIHWCGSEGAAQYQISRELNKSASLVDPGVYEIRRVIVIECDAAPAKKGQQP